MPAAGLPVSGVSEMCVGPKSGESWTVVKVIISKQFFQRRAFVLMRKEKVVVLLASLL